MKYFCLGLVFLFSFQADAKAFDGMCQKVATHLLPHIKDKRVKISIEIDNVFDQAKLYRTLKAMLSYRLSSKLKTLSFRLTKHKEVESKVSRAFDRFVMLKISKEQRAIRVICDIYYTERTLWERLSNHHVQMISHRLMNSGFRYAMNEFLRQKGDLKRRFIERRFPLAAQDILDLALFDIDGDQKDELISLHPQQIVIWRFKENRWISDTHYSLEGERNAVESKRAIGKLVVIKKDNKLSLLAKTSLFEKGERFDLSPNRETTRRALIGFPHRCSLSALCFFRRKKGRDYYFSDRTHHRSQSVFNYLPSEFYQLMFGDESINKKSFSYIASISLKGEFLLRHTKKILFRLRKVGIANRLSDLDLDGRFELILSSALGEGNGDEIRIFRHAGKAYKLWWKSGHLKGKIKAMAVGDPDGDGQRSVVAAIENGEGQWELLAVD